MQPHQEVFDRQQGTGWWALFGAPFLLVGIIAMIASVFRNLTYETGEPAPAVMHVVIFVVGMIFAGVGALFVFSRIGMTMDKRSGLVSVWWGLIRPMKSTTVRIEEVENVALTREDGESRKIYQISLSVADGDFELDSTGDYGDARELAEDVSAFLRVPLCDSSTGVGTVLSADEFHQSLRDRSRASGAVDEHSGPPRSCCVEHKWSDRCLTLEIPPPGMAWPAGVMMAVSLCGALAFSVYSIHDMAGDAPGFMVVLWGAALTVFIGSILIAFAKEILMARASERVVVSADGVEICFVSRLLPKRKRFRADEVEEVEVLEEAAGESNARSPKWARWRSHEKTLVLRTRRRIHEFGRGLTRGEAEWVRSAIRRGLTL